MPVARAPEARRFVVPAAGSDTVVFAYGQDEAPTILAVHGFRGTHHGLEPLALALATEGYRVLVPDCPGAGEPPC